MVALVVAVSLPSAYFAISYQYQAGAVDSEARFTAELLSQVINSNPDTWEFQQHRLEDVLSRRGHRGPPIFQRIIGGNGRLIVERNPAPPRPTLVRTAPLLDAGVPVGRIEIVSSLRPLVIRTGEVALVALVLGSIVFGVLRVLPLRALERSLAERQRGEARMRLESAALEAAADAVVITDREGTIQWVNRAFGTLTGYAPDEVVGRSPRVLKSGQHEPEYYRRLWDTILGGAVWQGEIVNRYRDGRLATEAMTITPVRGDDGAITHFIAIKRDVTATKDAERSRARLAAILEATPDFVATADPQGRILYFNRAARRLLGVPDDLDPSQVTIAGSHPPSEADLVLEEGIPAAMRDGIWHGETAIRSRSGRLTPVLQIIVAHKAPDGRVEFLSTIARDITERKQTEEEGRRQRELAAQNEKLAAMSTLLAGVAHELNNPLTVVVARAAMLRAQVSDEALAQHTTQIEVAAARCARIVKNFLAVARQHSPERAPNSLNLIVRDAVEMFTYSLRVDGVELRLDLAEDLPEFQADAHQLGQVIINLVSNAHHAVRGTETRRITVTTRHEAARGLVSLAVEDTGPGIPPDVERRIFEPFFTTKPIGQGTGLGLALCRRIAEDHGGALRVDGRPGRGARMVVELPVRPAPEPASGPEPSGAPAPIPHCTILVVDDEPEVASLVADVFAGDHHTVETVASGRAALERLAARSYDVILSDIRMPDLDGIALYRALEQRQPAACARMIFLTGDTLDPVLGEFLRSSGRPHVAKPFLPEQLWRALEQVLRPGPAGAPNGRGAAPPPPSR